MKSTSTAPAAQQQATRRRAPPPHAAAPIRRAHPPFHPLPSGACSGMQTTTLQLPCPPFSLCSCATHRRYEPCTPFNAVNMFCTVADNLLHLQLAVAVDANRLISSAQLHVTSPSGSVRRCAAALALCPLPVAFVLCCFCYHLLIRGGSAFSSPDIAAVGEVGAVSARRCL